MSQPSTRPTSQVRTLAANEIDTVAGGGTLSSSVDRAVSAIGKALATMAQK